MFRKVTSYLGKAVRSNTGVSSLSLLAVIMGIVAIIILLTVVVCMLVEMFTNHTIMSSVDYASIIGAVASLIAAAGLPKALNNYGENKFRKHPDEIPPIPDDE